jgi:DNA helicase-2/ATP-dependent DNA helicase PcrA
MLPLHSLNPQQRDAVLTHHGPVLILAGAGTGKTRVITFRIAHMIAEGIPPAAILAVTFTNKAAREMRERVTELLPAPRRRREDEPPAPKPLISTFHSFCVRVLRQHIEKLGYKRNFVIYSESEQLGAVKKILGAISSKGGEKVDAAAILSCLSRLKNGAMKATFSDDGELLARHIQARYASTLQLFREHPDVLAACRAAHQFVMVDEYQDTNAAQFELLQHLCGAHQNLCVVGDDDQSIYSFRGAEIGNLLDLEKHFPKVKVIKLEQNYRSTDTILQTANALIKHNARRRPKQLWSDKGKGALIQLSTYDTDEDEARSVVDQIEFNRHAKRGTWGDHAILFRTNQQSRPVETALRAASVRYHLIGGQSYFDRREVKDLLAYLKTFLNPHDDISLLRIANTPPRGLSDVTMERLVTASQQRHCSVFTALHHTDLQDDLQPRTRDALLAFLGLIESVRASLHTDGAVLSQWANRFLEATGYVADLRRSEKNPDTADNRVRNLADLVADLDKNPATTLPAADRLSTFLEEVTLDRDRKDDDEDAGDAVTLITMHSAKGLEYPHVFIVGLEEGLLPHARSKVENTLDEERRLFYVAITRARETLALSHCLARKKYGQLLPCHPSSFLRELPADLVERADEKARQPVKPSQGTSLFAAMRAATEG